MKVIIAGSRSIGNRARSLVADAVGRTGLPISELVCGCADGVDRAGYEVLRSSVYVTFMPAWAYQQAWAEKQIPPKGSRIVPVTSAYVKARNGAGRLRNVSMSEYGDRAIILWDGISPGSAHMIECMQKLGKPVHVEIIASTGTMTEIADLIPEPRRTLDLTAYPPKGVPDGSETRIDTWPCNDCGEPCQQGDELCGKCYNKQVEEEQEKELHPEWRCPPRE